MEEGFETLSSGIFHSGSSIDCVAVRSMRNWCFDYWLQAQNAILSLTFAYDAINRHRKEDHPISSAYRAVLFPAINRSHYYAPPRRRGGRVGIDYID